MNAVNTGDDSNSYYANILTNLKNLELSDDSEEIESKVVKLKRELCSKNEKSILIKIQTDLESSSVSSASKLCELIAELAKDDECRNNLIDANLFIPINNYLKNPKSTNNLKIQICRAIGNLCYENDNGRLKFYNDCSIDALIDLLKNVPCLFSSDTEEQKEIEKLLLVALGCLHNVTNENETLRSATYSHNIMNVLKSFISHLKSDLGILMYFFSCIENLTDTDEGKKQFVDEKVAYDLYKFLDMELLENLDNYTEDFFRILALINEINLSKKFLCESDFLKVLIKFIELNVQNDDLIRTIGGFVTDLLLNDDNIESVFNYGEDLLIEKASEWLERFESEQIYLISAVIIANYMRNDEKALKLVHHKNQPHVRILNILKKYNKLGSNATLQQINVSHSLLSTLKNFCIAASSKEELLKHEIIEVVLEFFNFENLEVKWKAVSIIRLLVKNCTEKNGLSLIFSEEVLEKIESIANNPQEHPGLTGESSRLSCYLPIAAKSEKNLEKFCKYKFINVICNQLSSEHFIMLNEALLSINVLIAINYRACHEKLKESSLNKNLTGLFEKDSLPIEMRINSFKIFKSLFERNDFFIEANLEDYLKVFKKLKVDQENELINSYLNQLINLLENAL